MLRLACVVLLVGASFIQAAAPAPKSDPKAKPETTIENIRKVLDSRVTFALNQPTGLTTAMAQLTDEFKINFILDKAVFQPLGISPDEVTIEISFKDTKLRNGLRNALAQHNLSFAIIGESVLVTSEEQAIYRQLKQRINVDYDNVPLHKALRDLAQAHGVNVVIDPKTIKNKAAEAPVTLTVDDVPFEAVVRLACEMAGLKPARMGNVIYITTEDRADKLKDTDSLVPNPNGPGGMFSPFNPGGGGGVLPIAPAFEEKRVQDVPEKP